MEREPVEIRPEDIRPRPPDMPVGTGPTPAEGGFSVADLRRQLQEFKELIALAQEMGLGEQLAALGIRLPGGRSAQGSQVVAPPAQNQVLNFIRLLKQLYGDITVNEALERLKADLGNKRLSELTGEWQWQ
ncbi:MAG TPA: hypothetical protein G4O01_02925 [Dehalococcoidia bacterium]|nr:hypothetical protein [Dehalococcoidia bacterium]